MKWEDARAIIQEIKKAKYRQSDEDKEILVTAKRHIDQHRNLSKDQELFITDIYRKAYGGGTHESRQII